MGMTDINTEKVNPNLGIIIGSKEAPIEIVEYVNLRCPFCRKWWTEKSAIVDEYVEKGFVKQTIKLFNKEKASLVPGNIMHAYVPNDETAKSVITRIYETQDIWGDLASLDDIASFAEDTLGLTKQNNETMLDEIVAETLEANVVFVPTMIVGDTYFDQKISEDELRKLLTP